MLTSPIEHPENDNQIVDYNDDSSSSENEDNRDNLYANQPEPGLCIALFIIDLFVLLLGPKMCNNYICLGVCIFLLYLGI